MAAIIIFGELDFVYGQELDALIGWHRFHRADPIASLIGNDALFACHERHGARAFCFDDTVINLTCEQAQR